MRKAKTVLLVAAIVFGVYAIFNLIINAISYGSYIEYYGLMQVLPTILEGFFGYAGWACVLFALSAICGYMGGAVAPVAEAVVEQEEAVEEPEAEQEEAVEEPVYEVQEAEGEQETEALSAEVIERETEQKGF